MPSASNWGYFLYVNLAFALFIALLFYYSSLNDIKKNWNQYRCNPMYMPFSDDMEKDFQYCIQSTQTNFMGYLLQPLTFMTSNLNENSGAFMTQINDIRAMFDKVRTFISDTIQSVFGVFLNIIIEFQKVTISIKDLMGKTIGILTTVMFMMDGTVKTGNSLWNGPPGQMVKSMGKCFYPDTVLTLQDGNKRKIKDITVGDVLEKGEHVMEVLTFHNNELYKDYEELYELKTKTGSKIYITGSHFVYNEKKFVEIKDYPNAIKQNRIKTDLLCCLITDTHRIHIDEYIFWDYDDIELRWKK